MTDIDKTPEHTPKDRPMWRKGIKHQEKEPGKKNTENVFDGIFDDILS